ncbi:DUF6343 family protein [Ornithinimicrobium murale]|uniref:DUF6343 family protein n=1 Tax=Ornithinimicrobium murale TaxID=1050153 RepID=UPI000E0D12B9|nr:DUF6343 family protein [Ornithinimicrobium murale]
MSREERDARSRAYPDHHDPTGGIGGAAPAHSALTLRLVLAVFGLLVCTVGAIWTLVVGGPLWLVIVLVVLAVVAVVDLVVIARRKGRGEPG